MKRPPSTVELHEDSTFPHPKAGAARAPCEASLFFLEEARALLGDIPGMLANRSLVIERVIDEYCAMLGNDPTLTPAEYCRRFSGFPSSLRSSIYRQLEVEHFVETHGILKDQRAEHCWPQCGDRFGSLQVQEELGRGSLARVYLCRQAELGNRQVVMKTGFMTKNEAHTLGRLQHDNIVPILSIERHPQTNTVIICMPFLGRSTLHDLIDTAFEHQVPVFGDIVDKAAQLWLRDSDELAPAPSRALKARSANYVDRIVRISLSLADALQHAHERGIIHGDIKPSNIILTPNGEPLLTDFNLSGNAALSIAPRGGTIPYMAPEHLMSHAERPIGEESLDPRADLFSLGVLMYELLTGKMPFALKQDATADHETINGLLRSQQQGCVALRSRNARVPRSLAAVIERCLSWRPDDRFSSALDLGNALRRENRVSRRSFRLLSRHKRLVASGLASITLVVAGVITFLATLPPIHERRYREALEFIQNGKTAAAKNALLSALDAMPSHLDARFELGRIELKSGDLRAAMDSFFVVATEHHDPRGSAYLGYAFGLKGQFRQAIPWLKTAVESGAVSGETMNNLAVAYELGDNEIPEIEQLAAARRLLSSALEFLPRSPTVRFNWINHDLLWSELGGTLDKHTIQLAYKLAGELPDCAEVNECAARVAVMNCSDEPECRERAIAFLDAAVANGSNVSALTLTTHPQWEPIRSLPQFESLLQSLPVERGASRNGLKIPRLLEPRIFTP